MKSFIVECGDGAKRFGFCRCCSSVDANDCLEEEIPHFYSESHAYDVGWREYDFSDKSTRWVCPECCSKVENAEIKI